MRRILVISGLLGMLLSSTARAQSGQVVAFSGIQDQGVGISDGDLTMLNNLLIARLTDGGYRMVPGKEAAPKTLVVLIQPAGQYCRVTAHMFDGEESSMETTEEGQCNIQHLSLALGRIADKLCKPLRPDPADKKKELVRVQFSSDPAGAELSVDGELKCPTTPCTLEVAAGTHEIFMRATRHWSRTSKVRLSAGQELHWELKPRPYSYLGMDHARTIACLITLGWSPSGSDYLVISTIEGASFFQLHPVLDAGVATEGFAYRDTPKGTAWSLFNVGPALRAGRLVVKSHFQLLSFKGGSWAPGFSVRVSIPLATEEDNGKISTIIPVPTLGYDLLFTDSCGYEQSQFWIGLGWVAGVMFE